MKTKINLFTSTLILVVMAFTSCAEENSTAEIRGCMNPTSVNYDPDANVEDGSCVEIPEKQNALFFKYTATWCHACGGYGYNGFNTVYNANRGDILAFTIQISDDLSYPSNQVIKDAFISKWVYDATPSFVANNVYLGNPYFGAQAEIDSKLAETPVAGTNLKWTVGGGPNTGKININAYTKFFNATSGEYYMGVYILFKNIVRSQNVDGTYQDDFEHHHVMYACTGSSPWGDPIASGNIAAGEVKHMGYVFPMDANINPANIEVVSVIWKKNGSSYDFVNCMTN